MKSFSMATVTGVNPSSVKPSCLPESPVRQSINEIRRHQTSMAICNIAAGLLYTFLAAPFVYAPPNPAFSFWALFSCGTTFLLIGMKNAVRAQRAKRTMQQTMSAKTFS